MRMSDLETKTWHLLETGYAFMHLLSFLFVMTSPLLHIHIVSVIGCQASWSSVGIKMVS